MVVMDHLLLGIYSKLIIHQFLILLENQIILSNIKYPWKLIRIMETMKNLTKKLGFNFF